MRRSWALIIVLVLLAFFTEAAAERLPMRLYTTEDGLWSSFSSHIMRDSHGFIWLCTRDGLSRFDGYRFINYKINGGPSSQNFTFMLESRDGAFWIALAGKGLYRYDPAADTTAAAVDHSRILLNAELVSSSSFRVLFQDRAGNLWAAGNGLFLLQKDSNGFSAHEIHLNLPQECALDGSDTLNTNFIVNLWVMNSDGTAQKPVTKVTATNTSSLEPAWHP